MKLCLIDAKNSLYRHNHTSNLLDPQGNKISGTFGLMKEIAMALKKFEPDKLLVVWDKGLPRERTKVYPEYKANRKDKNDEEFVKNLGHQIQQAKLIIKNTPAIQISIEGVEADDIIGWFVEKNKKGENIIYSSDNDFLQLVSDNTSQFLSTKKKLITNENIEEHLGFNPKHFLTYKALIGDNSDNIKGIKGIGEMTAKKILLGDKALLQKKKIDKEVILRNKKLMKIGYYLTKEDIAEIVNKYSEQKNKEFNFSFVKKRFSELNFKSLLYSFADWSSSFKVLKK
jgi:DNA polymerase-1